VREPDDFNVLLRFVGGAKGVLIASQVNELPVPSIHIANTRR
jgi:hypothetical protein